MNQQYNKPDNQYPQRQVYYQPPTVNQPYPPQQAYPQYDPRVNEEYRRRLAMEVYYKNKRRKERSDILVEGLLLGGAILLYLIIETVIVFIMSASKYYALYNSSAMFQNCFNIVAVHMSSMLIPFTLFALIMKKRYRVPVIPTKKLGGFRTFLWVSLGMGICMGANYVTNAVIELFKMGGYELSQPEMLDATNVPTLIAEFFAVAVVPAIFEEYAMRCCSLGVLRNHGKAFGVIAVSIVFGLIHGNVIQFVFAFIIGLILGYITVKTDSVIPAMLIHGFNNGLSVLNDVLNNYLDEKTSNYIVSAVVIVWAVLAVGSLICLIVKKDLLPEKQPKVKEPYALKLWEKLLCLVPGFFIPFVILIAMTSQFVKPIS